MKYYDLDTEEQELLDSVEKGEWQSVKNLVEVKKQLVESARVTLNKTRNINIRLSELDLLRLKAKALREGLPYQTLAASILKKSVVK